jgi:hypothetical protein
MATPENGRVSPGKSLGGIIGGNVFIIIESCVGTPYCCVQER